MRARIKKWVSDLGLYSTFLKLRRTYYWGVELLVLVPAQLGTGLVDSWLSGAYLLYPRLHRVKSFLRNYTGEKLYTIPQCASSGQLSFYVPNADCYFRAKTLLTKEPETLEWIDQYGGSDMVFYDVGASTGVFSIYAARKFPGMLVYAFEPSMMNAGQLVRNIFLNQLEHRVDCIFNPLSDREEFAAFNQTSSQEGSAMSMFGVDFDRVGAPQELPKLSYRTFGMGLDRLTDVYRMPIPDLMKIDVDGIEHLVLKGARANLRHVKTVLIEVDEQFPAQQEGVAKLLHEAGLTWKAKLRSKEYSEQPSDQGTYNHIWVRE